MIPKKEKYAFLSFGLILLAIALINLSSEKDTNDFISRQEGEQLNDTQEDRPLIEEIRERMVKEDMNVDTRAQPLTLDLETAKNLAFPLTANLEDYTLGDSRRGISTSGKAGGSAKAGVLNGQYNLLVETTGLPEPKAQDYFEVWLTRNTPFAYVSAGKMIKADDTYQLTFASTKDYSDYDFVYVSIEPPDMNPRPADFILQGQLGKILNSNN